MDNNDVNVTNSVKAFGLVSWAGMLLKYYFGVVNWIMLCSKKA